MNGGAINMNEMDFSPSSPGEPVYKCECCGFGIFPGDTYYDIGGDPICLYCARNCAIVLKKYGGVIRKPPVPICDYCKSEIDDEYIVFRGKNYCKTCISDCGETLTDAIFKANWDIAE